MADRSESKQTTIECDCGTHMLKIQSEVDYYDDIESGKTRFSQDFYFAMFSYGNQKRKFLARCVIAWKYLISGKMHSDQLIFNPDEAKKISSFINENIIEGER